MSTRTQRVSPIVAGIIAGVIIAVIVGIMAKINLDFAAPWASTHTMIMQVTDADGIGVSSDVRIAGRLVGQVTGVQSHGSYSDVVFHVENGEWPLPVDSTASIRLATLLGQKYVEIQPGKSTQQYSDDATIGLTKTKPVVDFDQILNTFDKPTRDSLTSLIRTAGGAVQNQEGTVQQLLPDLRQLSSDSTTGLSTLAENDGHFNSILVNLGVLADQLNASRNDFAGVIDNLNSVTGTLASHQDGFRGYIRNGDQLNVLTDQVLGNGGAQGLNAGLQRLNGVAHQVDNLLVKLIPQSQSSMSTVGAAVDLTYRIGDATSQSDAAGYFLRQNLQSIDTIGLTPNGSAMTAPGASGSSPQQAPPPIPGLPGLPTLPPAPSLPPVPSLPSVPSLPPAPTPSLNGPSGGTPPPVPTLPPLPTPPIGYGYGDGSASLAAFLFGT